MNTQLSIEPSLQILLVEDNPGDVLILKEHLRFSGINFKLVESSTLKEAIYQISHQNFDVILLDLGLPDSIGIETLKKFNLSALKTPVIVMTGLDDEEAAVTSLKEGAQDYLFKNSIDSQSIIHSIRYGIERKKIQELQKKNALQFSILAQATTTINETEEIPAIFSICCDSIKKLLNESHVFAIESLNHDKPPMAFSEWLEIGLIKTGTIDSTGIYGFIINLFEELKNFISKSAGGKLITIKGGLKEFSNGSFNPLILEGLEKVLGIKNTYLIGFIKNERCYGGIILFTGKAIEPDEISLIEVMANQVSLSIHRRTVEKDLVESEHKYRILNKDLEQRVTERTKDLARTNNLLEEELEVRIHLQKELMNSKKDLEIRVRERTAELARSEERFHKMFYNHEAVMLLIHPETGVIIDANQSAKNFYGHSFSASEPLTFFDINIQPSEVIKENVKNALALRNNYFILPHKLASGEIRTVEVYTSPIEMPGEKLLFGIIHDITERTQMELALKESEALYRAVVNNSLSLILISVDKVIEFSNIAAVDYIGIISERIIGKTLDELFMNSIISMEGSSFSGLILESVTQNRSVEIQLQDKKGNTGSYFLVRSNKIQYKGKDAIMSIFTDITENKNIEKYVLKRVIETEENDRKQFAADLHDDLGPILSTIKLRLDLMEQMNPSEELKENIAISNELTGLVVEKIRTISHNITPHLIETLGLDAGVRDLCKKIKELNKIEITLESDIESRRFSQPVELHYYRIISELVNNSLKHSQATKINILLSGKEDRLELIYSDNGIGYNYAESLQKPGGIGLRNILNRITLINGTINFSSKEGKTIVKIIKKIEPALVSFS